MNIEEFLRPADNTQTRCGVCSGSGKAGSPIFLTQRKPSRAVGVSVGRAESEWGLGFYSGSMIAPHAPTKNPEYKKTKQTQQENYLPRKNYTKRQKFSRHIKRKGRGVRQKARAN